MALNMTKSAAKKKSSSKSQKSTLAQIWAKLCRKLSNSSEMICIYITLLFYRKRHLYIELGDGCWFSIIIVFYLSTTNSMTCMQIHAEQDLENSLYIKRCVSWLHIFGATYCKPELCQ